MKRLLIILLLILPTVHRSTACTYYDDPETSDLLTYAVYSSNGDYVTTFETGIEINPCGEYNILDRVENNKVAMDIDGTTQIYDLTGLKPGGSINSLTVVEELPFAYGGDWTGGSEYLHSYNGSTASLKYDVFPDPLVVVDNVSTGDQLFNISVISVFALQSNYSFVDFEYSNEYNTSDGSVVSKLRPSIISQSSYGEDILLFFSVTNNTDVYGSDGVVIESITEVVPVVATVSLISGGVKFIHSPALSEIKQEVGLLNSFYRMTMGDSEIYMMNYTTSRDSMEGEWVRSDTDIWKITSSNSTRLLSVPYVVGQIQAGFGRVVTFEYGDEITMRIYNETGDITMSRTIDYGNAVVLKDFIVVSYILRYTAVTLHGDSGSYGSYTPEDETSVSIVVLSFPTLLIPLSLAVVVWCRKRYSH